MTYGKWTWAAAVAVLGGVMLATDGVAASSMGGPATRPTTRAAMVGKHRGVVKPWSELTTLTPKQEDQIARIHEDATEQEKKMKQKEHDDIVALLTPDQQNELRDLDDSTKESRKGKNAAARKRREAAAATRPGK